MKKAKRPVVYACSKYPGCAGCPLSCVWRGSMVKAKAERSVER